MVSTAHMVGTGTHVPVYSADLYAARLCLLPSALTAPLRPGPQCVDERRGGHGSRRWSSRDIRPQRAGRTRGSGDMEAGGCVPEKQLLHPVTRTRLSLKTTGILVTVYRFGSLNSLGSL